MKKLLSLVCALALILSCVPGMFASAEEPVTIKWYTRELGRNACAYYSDTAWVQELENRMNVKIEFCGPAAADDYNTAANLMLISGEYPDILYYDWNRYDGGALMAVEDGIIVPYSEIPEYKALVPNWFKVLEEKPEVRRMVTQDDGSIVTFCHWETDMRRNAYWGYAIRKDWLDRLNLEVPTTVEELYNVLVAFRDNDANGNGDPTDEIPFTSCNWWSSVHPGIDSLAAAWGLKCNVMYMNPQTGTPTFWTEYNDGENFKDYVLTMRKWYEEGLIDAEYVSQNYDSCAAKITGDKAGVFFCFPDSIGNYKATMQNTIKEGGYADPELVNIYGLVPLKGADGVAYAYDADNAFVSYAGASQPTVVTTAAVKRGVAEKCFELINFMYSEEGSEIINWGVEGLSYTKNADGTHAWTEAVTNDPDYGTGDAVFKYALPTMGGWPKAMSYEAWYTLNITTPDAATTHANYGMGDTSLDLPSFALNEDETDAYTKAFTEVTTAVGEVYHQVITGIKPVEELDALLKRVDDMKVDKMIEAYETAYARFLAK